MHVTHVEALKAPVGDIFDDEDGKAIIFFSH